MSAYFESLAFLFLTDEEFQNTASASGVDWFKLPEKLDAVKIVRGYLEKRATMPHAAALNAVRGDLRFLEAAGLDFKLVPADPVALAFEHKSAIKAMGYADLAKRLAENPARGDAILAAFEGVETEAAKSSDLSALIEYEVGLHRERVKQNEALVVVPGFENLSNMIGGFNRGNLVAITAATGFGKTNFGFNLALRAASKMRVAYGNFEMTDATSVKRSIVIGTGTTYDAYKAGEIDQDAVDGLKKHIGDRIQITHGRALSLQSIEAWARMLKRKQGLDFLFIDYDQKILLNTDARTPEWKALQNVFCRLDDFSKEIGVCIVIFAQVNREGEISGSYRAIFSADTVLSFEVNDEHGPVIVARKNRHGKKDDAVRVEYDERNSRISEKNVINVGGKPKPEFKPKKIAAKKTQSHWSTNL